VDPRVTGGKLLQFYLWLATGIGWVLTTAGIAALTGILRRGSAS
jgi:hypothetical protein